MKKINISNYYYLKEGKTIKQEEISCGATKFNGKWITNYSESNEILVNNTNKLSIYVPSTIDVNKVNENFEKLTEDTIKKLQKELNTNVERYDTKGAWKTEEGTIVYEDINILTIDTNGENFENNLDYFIRLAKQFKVDLAQEGISIGINNGLLII